MAKVLVSDDFFTHIFDFVDQLESMVGHVEINRTMVQGVYELCFESNDFAGNEIVMARVYRNNNMKYKIVGIQATEKHFIQY